MFALKFKKKFDIIKYDKFCKTVRQNCCEKSLWI